MINNLPFGIPITINYSSWRYIYLDNILLSFSNQMLVFAGSILCALFLLMVAYRIYVQISKQNTLLLQSNHQLVYNIKLLEEKNEHILISQQKLKNSNTTKDKFFSIISHDIKGPLNSLTGLLQILVKYVDSFSKDELKDFGKNMNKSVNNLLELLNNLFSWSQTQTGTIAYNPVVVRLDDLIQKTIDLLEPAAENKLIKVNSKVSANTLVFADEHMISFTLRNLLSNAIKFSNFGGSICIFSKMQNGLVEIAVADNGIGLSMQDIEKLFKIDKCHTTNGTANEIGTGLGLILCSEFIEKNGGSIQVESQLHKGSVFRFTLPVATSPAELLLTISH